MPNKLAAQLYTVRDFTKTTADFAASIKKVADIGYMAVQVSAIGAAIPDTDVKSILDDHGLICCNTHVRPAEALWDDIDSVVAQHQLWDCKHAAIGGVPQRYRQDGVAGFQRFVESANQIGEKLHAAGMTFSYHNHSWEYVRVPHNGGTRTLMDLIFEETDPRFVQAEIDVYWVQHGGADPIDWIRKMKDRMPVIHLKDMVVQMAEGNHRPQQVMAEVGEGNLNWPGILQACEEANVEWYAVEQDICQRDPFESLQISYENLQSWGLS